MNIKKFISVGLCALTVATSLAIPVSAAKSADPNDSQIVSKVEQFNNSGLAKLREYIWKTNYKFIKDSKVDIVKDLIALYRKLDDLVVSSIDIADDLCPSYSIFHPLASNSIGGHVDLLIMFLGSIDAYGIDQNAGLPFRLNESWPVFSTKNEINILNDRLDKIDFFKNKNKR